MKQFIAYASFFALAGAHLSGSSTHAVQKREDGDFECYTTTHIFGFSGGCPNLNYPIDNDRGLSVMGNLYFALASTSVPDNTVYNAQENIICTINGRTGNVTATVGAQAGSQLANAGASVSFSFKEPNWSGNSICMFTEGTGDDNKNVTDPITLARARDLLLTMLTAPNVDCKTCARIPIRYPQVQDGSGQGGGILKLDVRSANNCIGKCVGPNSFTQASPSPSPTPSKSAAAQITPFSLWPGGKCMNLAIAAWLLWAVVCLRFALHH